MRDVDVAFAALALLEEPESGGVAALFGIVQKGIIAPLQQLTDAMMGIAEGERTGALPPVTGDEIREALLQLRLAPLLTGYRGRPAADLASAITGIEAMAEMITPAPAIDEIEVNPLMLGETGAGALAADAVIWKTDSSGPSGRETSS
mgnify:CR=1 FL=1